MTTFRLFVRDTALQRVALVEDFQTAEFIGRFNDVGTWTITLDGRLPAATYLTAPGYGIELVREVDGQTVLSGPMTKRQRRRGADLNEVVVSGVDDNVWLARRRAHPQPGTAAPPYSSTEYDVRTNTCTTVLDQYVDINAGPGALAVRQVPGLTVPAVLTAGATVTGRARWQVLLTLLQELALAGGDLGFRVRQSGSDLEFRPYEPEDKTGSVVFSLELGNLASYDYDADAPQANYWWVGGGGEGTARTIEHGQSSTSVTTWGRIENFIDRRDTTDTSELEQEIAAAIDEQGERTSLEVVPIDTDGQSYGTHYDLGDIVTVVVEGAEIQEAIREVRIALTPDGPQRTVPVIGTPGRHDVLALFRRVDGIAARTTNLERR